MASPQLENGYTQIANEIIEALMKTKLSGYQSRVLWAILRKTYGWHKKEDWISLSQLAKMTTIYPSHTSRTIKELIKRNIVTKIGNKIAFNKNYTKWKKLPKLVTPKKLPKMVSEVTKNGNREIPKMVTKLPNLVTTKETVQKKLSTKETNTKENSTKEKNNYVKNKIFDDITSQELVDLYNEICNNLPKVAKLTKSRLQKIRLRLKENPDKKVSNREMWTIIFNKVNDTPFLRGENKSGWCASLDWLIANDKNYIKVLEGVYDRKIQAGVQAYLRKLKEGQNVSKR